MANIDLRIKLGPLVSLAISGQSCEEISEALKGFEVLNQQIDSMCGELAENIYPQEPDPTD
ncbi:MAG: hypothetical protein GWN61_17195 [candidate division Zixibacteria bacterium]|nr:hypothetical protein [candidate division Zixibacteria bacterium]NIS47611.1 hypothetical protein [candidate division Zixibacteria bacterium]NIU15700.1 hypothetical protein [candidate division Zixibacteria bacterium]NIV07858.1 hypothetical protein [candidate division Zixibacteria bacterium]NIX58076.1 hypothetical protein [candidate division Zixibacteria bacterium]